MTITLIGAATANGDSITIPSGHRPHDLIVIAAYRAGSASHVTAPSGWMHRRAQTGASNVILLSTKLATSESEVSGTWTNATQMGCWVFRGDKFLSVGITSTQNAVVGSGGNVSYGALNVESTIANKWLIAAIGHRSIDTDIESPPSGMSFRSGVVDGSAGELALHDTDGNYSGLWPLTNVTLTTGTSSGFCSVLGELVESDVPLPSFVYRGLMTGGCNG